MTDGEGAESPGEEPTAQQATHRAEEPRAEFRMELRGSLPGDRAVIGVEREGEFVWLASEKYIHPKAVDEFVEQLTRIVREGWWVQNWPGAR